MNYIILDIELTYKIRTIATNTEKIVKTKYVEKHIENDTVFLEIMRQKSKINKKDGKQILIKVEIAEIRKIINGITIRHWSVNKNGVTASRKQKIRVDEKYYNSYNGEEADFIPDYEELVKATKALNRIIKGTGKDEVQKELKENIKIFNKIAATERNNKQLKLFDY